MGIREVGDTHVVRGEVSRCSYEDLGEGDLELRRVCLVRRPHTLDERLAGFFAFSSVVVPAIRGKNAFLEDTT